MVADVHLVAPHLVLAVVKGLAEAVAHHVWVIVVIPVQLNALPIVTIHVMVFVVMTATTSVLVHAGIAVFIIAPQLVAVVVQAAATDLVLEHVQDNAEQPVAEAVMKNA